MVNQIFDKEIYPACPESRREEHRDEGPASKCGTGFSLCEPKRYADRSVSKSKDLSRTLALLHPYTFTLRHCYSGLRKDFCVL